MLTETAEAREPTRTEPSAAPSDEEIVARVLQGERELFELLMRRHNRRIYRTVRAILRDEAESEDAMQASYLAAFANLGSFRGGAAFSTWLTRIAVNEAFGRLRRRAGLKVVEGAEDAVDQLEGGEPSPERHAAARELVGMLEQAVDRLPPSYRTIFMLREIEGLSTSAAAASLGIGEELAKVRLLRARRALRGELTTLLGADAPAAFAFEAPRCDRVVHAVMARLAAGAPPAEPA